MSGVVRVKMSIMVIANFVILKYNVARKAQLLQHSTKKKHSLDEKQSKLQFTCE